jgi:pimeloyl-ACP methyl ester carboxylesterase
VRLIGIDRPGIGRSDAMPGRRLTDWPADAAAVADALGLERFAVLGLSAGGPYAAACARALGGRLTAAGIVCGVGPPESRREAPGMHWPARVGLAVAARSPLLAAAVCGPLAHLAGRHAGTLLAGLERIFPAPDRAVLARTDVRTTVLRTFREGVRQGGRGLAEDLTVLATPWGFALEAVRARVLLWHGELDTTVPPAMGRHVAARIPGCQARFLPGEGHFSLPIEHMDEILRALTVPGAG